MRKRQQLANAINAARQADAIDYQTALSAHESEVLRWQWFQQVASGVLQGEVEACRVVLEQLGPFKELEELGSALNIAIEQPWCVEAWFAPRAAEIIPTEEVSLTTTGKLSHKAMAKGKYWALYQDHVCSAAFRIAREIFALLPVPIALVHAGMLLTNKATGLPEYSTVLSVAFERDVMSRLELSNIDPSDALANFEHAMKFKKTSGFTPVEPLLAEEFEVLD